SSAESARPLAPNGGKPAVASCGSCETVVTAHGVEHVVALAILKMAPWNESETNASPAALKTMPLGAGNELEPNVMVSALPSGLGTVRGPGAPIFGNVATVSTGVFASKSPGMRCSAEAPKLRM